MRDLSVGDPAKKSQWFWVTKAWLTRWRKNPDKAARDEDINAELACPHGNMVTSEAVAARVSSEVWNFLREEFVNSREWSKDR